MLKGETSSVKSFDMAISNQQVWDSGGSKLRKGFTDGFKIDEKRGIKLAQVLQVPWILSYYF